ncbi:MAG: hypothetical protein JNM94_01935 [Phycisphaerae bacterium]|nr:hypothetical protein [Phycisphaerae bacterium]
MKVLATAAAVLAASMAGVAAAGTSSLSFGSTVIDGFGTLGKYSGSIDWTHTSGAGSGTLTVTLKNLATTASGGKLTGFVFNGPLQGLSYALSTKPNAAWSKTSSNENAAPFGSYTVGAALGGNFLGGGNPNNGLGIGSEFSFDFTVSGNSSILDALSASSFWTSSDGNPAFVARFRGFAGGGSDKSPAAALQVVPVPLPVGLAAAGLIGAIALRRRTKA